jgi:hypothetical protein
MLARASGAAAAALFFAGVAAAGPPDGELSAGSAEMGRIASVNGRAIVPLEGSVASIGSSGAVRYRDLPGTAEIPSVAPDRGGFVIAWRDFTTAASRGVFWTRLASGRLEPPGRVAALTSNVEGPVAAGTQGRGSRSATWSDRGRLLFRRRGPVGTPGPILDVGEEPAAVQLVKGSAGAAWVVSTLSELGADSGVVARRISANGRLGPEVPIHTAAEATQELRVVALSDGRGGLFVLVATDEDTLDAAIGGRALVRVVHVSGGGRARGRTVIRRGAARRVAAALVAARGRARLVYSDRRSRRRTRRGIFVRAFARRGRLGRRRRLLRRGIVEGAAVGPRGRLLHVLVSGRRGLSLRRFGRRRGGAVRVTRDRSHDGEQITVDRRGRAYVVWLALTCRGSDESDEPEFSAYSRVIRGRRASRRRLIERCG